MIEGYSYSKELAKGYGELCDKFHEGFERSLDIFNGRTLETQELERTYEDMRKEKIISLTDCVKLYFAQTRAMHAEYERGYEDALNKLKAGQKESDDCEKTDMPEA